MATIQEIIAKRKEMGAGTTNVDARKALEPVSATSQANIDQLAANKARVQSQIQAGTRPDVGTSVSPQAGQAPAPVTPPAPTTTPSGATLDANGVVTPAPVQTEQDINKKYGGTIQPNGINSVQPINAPTEMPAQKIEAVKAPTVKPTEAPIDYNSSQGREQDIQSNIKQITTDNPALLKDRNAYNQAFGYETADAGKKAMLDASFTGANTPVLMNQKDIVSALVSGLSVPEQNTQAYRNATVVANQFKKFNSMTDVQLLDNLKQGQIGAELDGLLSQNPNYIKAKQDLAKFQKTASINRAISTISNVIKGNEVTQEDDLAKIESKYQPPLGVNAQAYQDYVVNNADVVSAGAQVKQLSTQISDLTKSYNDALKSIKSQYGDMPASALLTLMGSRTSETKELLDSYINAKELAKGDFDLAMKMAEGSYEAYSKDLANQAVIDKEKRDLQTQKDLLQYKSDFEKKQAQEALNDPYIAIPQIIEEYKKLGIPFTRSTQEIIKDFESSGKDIATYITDLQKTIQSKPEYQAYKDKQSGTEWQSTSITRYNPATGANESTPIFYRKKTNGEFEAVDLAGNKIDSSVLSGGGVSTGTPGTLPTSFTGDTTSYIASKEGFRDKAYQDSAGVWTIGYGTTKINGKPIQPGQTITQADAQKQLDADIAKHSTWKTLIDEKTLSDSQKTALASFEYNLGPGIWNKSAMNIIDMIKSGDLQGAGKEMQKYVNAGGKVVKGLQNRRAEEAQLLQSTGTNTTPTQTYSPDKIKSFEAFNGTTFPSDYKTPAQQKQYRDEYNAWVASKPGKKIETGNDLINIKLDKPTEGQSASLAFGARMIDAAKNAQKYEDEFNKLPLAEQIYQSKAPELLTSQNQKSLMREKMDFITAVLRKESGAAISPSEFSGQDKIFFPQPGDGPEVLLAKRNARNFRVKAMLATAGTDTEGNSVSKYYNPPIITNETDIGKTPVKTDKITTLKKTYFP